MLIPIADQQPGVELSFIGGRIPDENARWKYDAVEVGQGYESRFYECPVRDPVGIECVDGVWHWNVETEPENVV